MAIGDVQEKLEQWGRWQSGRLEIGYNSVLGRLRGSTVKSALISDDEALRIDGIMAELKRTNESNYHCVLHTYRDKMGLRAVGRKLDLSFKTVQRRIKAAEHWLNVAFVVEKII